MAVVLTTGLMMPLNMLITPIYTGANVGYIISIIPTLLLPFNFIKTLMNSALVLILYKPVSTALKKARVIEGHSDKYRFDITSILLLVVGGAIVAACVVLFIVIMGGNITFG